MQFRKTTSNEDVHSVSELIAVIQKGVLLLALAEHYQIKTQDIVGISDDPQNPSISFTKEGFAPFNRLNAPYLKINPEGRIVTVTNIKKQLHLLSKEKIFNKFPSFWLITDEREYSDSTLFVKDKGLFKRCSDMQKMWKEWGSQGLPHLISSHQALQRVVASKMRNPLACDFNEDELIENGLSIEYQCEIYANGLYGAKLLDIWHAYLIKANPKTHHPRDFLEWLNNLSQKELNEFEITNLKEVPRVVYMSAHSQRKPWLLQFKPGNVVESEKLPKTAENDEETEIIYALGHSSDQLEFFGGPKKRGFINHSSFFAGKPVCGAGRIILRCQKDLNGHCQWIIHRMDNNSGHIKPNDEMTYKTLMQLKKLGVNLKRVGWQSKWGSIGQRDEAASLALSRLENRDLPVKTYTEHFVNSKRILKITYLAFYGELKELNQYLYVRLFKIRVHEALTVASLINQALQRNFSSLFGMIGSQDNQKFVRSLQNQAVQLLKNVCVQPSNVLYEIAPRAKDPIPKIQAKL